MTITLDKIKDAAKLVESSSLLKTPFLYSRRLSLETGVNIYVKYENLQRTNAFKARGALVKLNNLTDDEKKRGVIAMSAGNHAQAVAYHAKLMGIDATIVMPTTTPFVKVEQTKSYGAKIVLEGETFSDCLAATERLMAEHNLVLIHPFDDDDVMIGQGTIGVEMLEEEPDLDCIIVPIGGGGLISGIAHAAKEINPKIEIVGVEAALYPTMHNALNNDDRPCGGHTLAEGIAVKTVGVKTKRYCEKLVDDIILVEENEIEQAVNQTLINLKNVAEGAGAVGLAAIMQDPTRFKDKKVGIIISGGNIDNRILASVLFRELERSNRIVNLRMKLPDQPGLLAKVSTLLGDMGANILDVSHSRTFLDIPAKVAILDVTIESRDHPHTMQIIEALKAADIDVTLLKPNS